ncbi:GDP-mannose 4,6-dehydratase [Acetobacteraceae bacterium KSS8]|uniref:GDP-mannose 4,6-dehydratase n=1 Tax=Endosaccharibacter trunci TaxID=2812733 RepID=A0ABT1W8V3_9PROT|nr:GDP-mannose 4,6-dehydratase [Acetobacteraceae bacterium KSS8]
MSSAGPARVLVSGLSGFAGSHLRASVARLCPDTVLLPLDCDLRDAGAVEQDVRALRPDACLHLAAVSAIPVAQAEPDRAWAVNLHGTLSLARAMRAHAPDAPFLFVSSADAYGASFRSGLPLDETAPLAPMNLYGATKAAADLALGAMAADGARVIRLRPFNHVGPGQQTDFAIPAFARQLARIAAGRQEAVIRTGNLESERDFLHVSDVCDAYALCLRRAHDLPPGSILNIASGTPRRIGDVLDALIRLSGLDVSREIDPARMRPADIPRALGDAGRARALLGWVPRIDWEQTLSDVLADWTARVATES